MSAGRVQWVQLLLAASCGWPLDRAEVPGAVPAADAREPSRAACLAWSGPPRRLTPDDGRSRHHPTAARLSGGTLLVSWQVGRADGAVAVTAMSSDLQPLGAEAVISPPTDTRATHPQLASGSTTSLLVWTHDPTGAVRYRELDSRGHPVGPTIDLVADGARAGFYPDLSFPPAGPPLLFWYGGAEPTPAMAWGLARKTGPGPLHTLPLASGAQRGGPGTVRHVAGTPWVAWPELSRDTKGGSSRVLLAPLSPEGPGEPVEVVADRRRFERIALGLADDGGFVVGWTQYAVGDAPWNVWTRVVAADGMPRGEARRHGSGGGRMLDLETIGDLTVLGWEEPHGEDHDLVLELMDARTGETTCGPVRVHPNPEGEQARANLVLWEDEGTVQGLVVWQAGDTKTALQTVLGRRFYVP